mgnify:CR=1 FL=1
MEHHAGTQARCKGTRSKGSMKMTKLEQIYEGKAKKVFRTDDPAYCVVEYKDDATAFNGLKKGTILGKGAVNNRMTNLLMQMLEQQGIPTHFVKELSDRETAVKKVSIVPLEVIIRNISAGSFAKRYGVEEGIVFDAPTIEFSYKNDSLGDPLINSYHALALKLATAEELEQIKALAFRVNDLLKGIMKGIGIDLVDFKLEFGRLPDGSIGDALYRAKITLSTGELFAWTFVIILLSAVFEKLFLALLDRAVTAVLGEERA